MGRHDFEDMLGRCRGWVGAGFEHMSSNCHSQFEQVLSTRQASVMSSRCRAHVDCVSNTGRAKLLVLPKKCGWCVGHIYWNSCQAGFVQTGSKS